MQQKIVIKVPMKKEKDRAKAMKIAVEMIGVSSVRISGEDRDIVVVIGKVDAVTLVRSLYKKFGGATLVRVEPLMIMRSEYEREEDQPDNSSIIIQGQPSYYNNYNHVPPPPPYYHYYSYDARPVYDHPGSCSIL